MNYNCLDLPDHQQVNCPGSTGGIDSYAVLLPGWEEEINDLESEVDWNSAIDAGVVKVVKAGHVKGELGEASPVEAENHQPCGAENIVIGHDYEANIRDFGVNQENSEFYNALKRSKADGIAIGTCDGELYIVKQRPQFHAAGTPNIPESNREWKHYVIPVHWYEPIDGEGVTIVDKPEGIFN